MLTACSVTALLVVVMGCAEGPLWRLGVISPWARRQWADDARYGPTIRQQMADLSILRRKARSMGPVEQAQICQELARRLESSDNTQLRAAIAGTLAAFPQPVASQALHRALHDSEPTVRMAACQAWGERGDQEAMQALARTIGSDTDLDVRIAAARELAAFADPVAIGALGLALNDADPALQRRAMDSLQEASGQDYGYNVEAWRTFIAGGQPVVERPSLAERWLK